LSKRKIVMIRAPEIDPETRAYEQTLHGRTASEALQVDFSTRAGELAIDLLHALQGGEIVAIQGDRVTPGIATIPATLFGKETTVPAGPFALAMAAHVPIYPLFVVRRGRRRYRLITLEPFDVQRARNRAEVFEKAARRWTVELERVVRSAWQQWYMFYPFVEEGAE
jgi:predicted LPLAT superfamily acyltransferase